MIDQIFEAVLVVITINTGVRVLNLGRKPSQGEQTLFVLAQRRLPLAAMAIVAALVAGSVLEASWPGALDALRRSSSSHQWWRVFTAPFVQESVLGAVFNIVTAAIVLALAEWTWGWVGAVALWLLGAWAPLGDLATLTGYHVSTAHQTAYSAGSSGATYFVAATLCAALLIRGRGRERLLALIGPAIAVFMWFLRNDGHGVLFTEGFVLALVLCASLHALPRWHAAARTAPAAGWLQPPVTLCGSLAPVGAARSSAYDPQR